MSRPPDTHHDLGRVGVAVPHGWSRRLYRSPDRLGFRKWWEVTLSQSLRLDEHIDGATELGDSLPQVVEMARQTQRPMIITRRNRPVAAIIDISELQRLHDELDQMES